MSIQRIRVTMDNFHFGRYSDMETGPLQCEVKIERFGQPEITTREVLPLDIWHSAFDHIWEKLGRDIKRHVEECAIGERPPKEPTR